MAYDFATLQADFFARGFDPYNDAGTKLAMVKRFLNDAMHWVDDQLDWPYLQGTTTGTTPLTIADLGTIENVADVTGDRSLEPADRRQLRALYGDLTTTGYANVYYSVGGVISLYPVQSNLTITVDYWKVAPDMSASGDVPLMPDRYRSSIVEYAAARLHRVRREADLAMACQQAGDAVVAQMAQKLLLTQHQATQDFMPAYGDDV